MTRSPKPALRFLDDPTASEVPRGQLDDHPIAHEHAHEIPLEAAADVRRNVVRIDLNFIQPARQLRANNAFYRACALAHTDISCFARFASAGSSVRISQPSAVTTTVCSK